MSRRGGGIHGRVELCCEAQAVTVWCYIRGYQRGVSFVIKITVVLALACGTVGALLKQQINEGTGKARLSFVPVTLTKWTTTTASEVVGISNGHNGYTVCLFGLRFEYFNY